MLQQRIEVEVGGSSGGCGYGNGGETRHVLA